MLAGPGRAVDSSAGMKLRSILLMVPAAVLTLGSCGSKEKAPGAGASNELKVPQGFVLIPAGSFLMGDALDGMTNAPVHEVTVSGFYLAKLEVTKGEWDKVREWGAAHGYADLPMGGGSTPTHPVQGITWYALVKWCNACSEQAGFTPCYYTDAAHTVVYKSRSFNIDNTMVNWRANGYRLPTEAEWEKAARGGLEQKRFPWGDTISHSLANFNNSGSEAYQTGTRDFHPASVTGGDPYTMPVGSFAPNEYGLYDMAGNVWEGCWDWFGNYSVGAQTDPRGVPAGLSRVVRGGSCCFNASFARCAYRDFNMPGGPGNYSFGFRLARSQL